MRQFGTALAIAAMPVQLPVSATAQSAATGEAAAPAKPLSTCERLARDWRSVEIELAENYADGITDDSAPRATMRAARNTESLMRADITLNLMRDNKCTLPKRAPSELTYSLNAMECRTEQMRGNLKAPQCDYSSWKPLGQ